MLKNILLYIFLLLGVILSSCEDDPVLALKMEIPMMAEAMETYLYLGKKKNLGNPETF